MLLIPAIDLKDGHCVRLIQGDMDQSTTFGEDPAAMAAKWLDAGARRLHLVDLNGAFAGASVNAEAVRAIIAATDVPVQLGGGLRDMAAIARWLEAHGAIDPARTVYQHGSTKSTQPGRLGGKVLGCRFSENLNNPSDPLSIQTQALVGAEDPAVLAEAMRQAWASS
mgnify:CR=1 FL=1